jgi:hypothetical protein
VPFEEADGLVGDFVRVEEAGVRRLVFDVLRSPRQRSGLVVAAAAGEGAVEVVETPLGGPRIVGRAHLVREVPLADGSGGVSVLPEDLCRRHAAIVEIAAVATRAVVIGENTDPGLVRMQPGQEGGP